jgi:hypothetical protein
MANRNAKHGLCMLAYESGPGGGACKLRGLTGSRAASSSSHPPGRIPRTRCAPTLPRGRSKMSLPTHLESLDAGWTVSPSASTACRDSACPHAELVEEDRLPANVVETVERAASLGNPGIEDNGMGKAADISVFHADGTHGCACLHSRP